MWECGKAAQLADKNLEEYCKKIKNLRDYYIEQVKDRIPNIRINGSMDNRLPGNANISFDGVDGEALLYELDKRGICASSGSACSTGSPEPSHVLVSLGLSSSLANGALRVTFGEENTKEDVDYLVEVLEEIVAK